MKKTVYSLLLALGSLGAAQAQVMPAHRECATMEVLDRQLAADPGLAARLQAIDQQATAYAAQKAAGRANLKTSSGIIVTIPVVVHVLYNTAAQNITDAQVQSQIDVLNADYHKLNGDLSKVPAAFASLVGDAGVQFVLAKQDPSGKATTGIIHKSTTATSFDTSDKMKYSSSGGDDAWPAGSYLNMWSCNLGGGLLGYAQFPGGAAATDGVAILYSAFGTGGSAVAPYGLGRTATHEVGHWLNLRHIWGDARCGNDQVSDTPTQQTSNYGCPAFPHVTCSNGPNGDMFMNYMDYVDDACMQMFSSGQGDRMDALFASGGTRVSLLSSVGGLAPGTLPTPTPTPTPTVVYCTSQGNSAAQFIDYVQLGSISRSSGADGGYFDGTASSTSVAPGSSQTISFSAGFANKAYTEYFDVYADWNQDGDFADAGETLLTTTGSSGKTTRSGTFTVPASASPGATRLRVVMSNSSATGSCGTYSGGETEDYTLTVSGAAARSANTAVAYSIYPNPATDVLSIQRPASVDAAAELTVRVYDLRGAEVHGLTLADDQLRIGTLSQGVYLLTIGDGTTTSHQRFVKQ
ncbi:GEVED domain-containing protein [Hymenobacter cheonanensis]|uniref:GEVED domain-containing protein n=1 Tax=Hymenobacter sp. CA2-7 TaxID=3063993 RepID=UPI0027140AE0|nr:GEVED domain-containing protein [Hymenobacter sp. CA2-7]MDO7886091.1 GEVED domain-containing protein [Hymenobacter sp. CA2-7]